MFPSLFIRRNFPSSNDSGIKPVSKTSLKKDTYVGNKIPTVDFKYSLIILSFDELLLFLVTGHFLPNFIFNLVISYLVWSFRTHFYYFLENPFGHFVPTFYCFVPKSFRTRSHFVPILVISYPGHFLPTSKVGTN